MANIARDCNASDALPRKSIMQTSDKTKERAERLSLQIQTAIWHAKRAGVSSELAVEVLKSMIESLQETNRKEN